VEEAGFFEGSQDSLEKVIFSFSCQFHSNMHVYEAEFVQKLAE
jgi:hypothetical protein